MNITGTMLEDWLQEFCIMEKTRVPDGAGGYKPKYTEGADIDVVQRHDQTINAQIAEKEGTASTYTFFVDKELDLDYHDVLKRKKDGVYFRVTIPDGKKTPSLSSLDTKSIVCEKWELPNE